MRGAAKEMLVLPNALPMRVPDQGDDAPDAVMSLKSMSVMAVKVATDNVWAEPTVTDRSHNLATPVVPDPSVNVPLTVVVPPASRATCPTPAAALAVKVRLLNVLLPVIETVPCAVLLNVTL